MQKLNLVLISLLFIIIGCAAGLVSNAPNSVNAKVHPKKAMTIGTYGSPPRTADGTILYNDLIKQLKDLHANTYDWLIMPNEKSFQQFKEFLPIAQKDSIEVWATLIPPTELKGKPEQYSTDDLRKWAKDFAELSVTYPNFKVWEMDDFMYNLNVFTPSYISECQEIAKKINPDFKFIPICYYKFINQKFVSNYGNIIDGILFPYRNESVKADLVDYSHVADEMQNLRNLFGSSFPILLDVYSSSHSTLGDPTPEYISNVIQSGMQNADGVMIYRHPHPKWDAEKYKAVKEGIAKGLAQK
jgi:hypothetical protein